MYVDCNFSFCSSLRSNWFLEQRRWIAELKLSRPRKTKIKHLNSKTNGSDCAEVEILHDICWNRRLYLTLLDCVGSFVQLNHMSTYTNICKIFTLQHTIDLKLFVAILLAFINYRFSTLHKELLVFFCCDCCSYFYYCCFERDFFFCFVFVLSK